MNTTIIFSHSAFFCGAGEPRAFRAKVIFSPPIYADCRRGGNGQDMENAAGLFQYLCSSATSADKESNGECCHALSGQWAYWAGLTQGVALGYHAAPFQGWEMW